MFLRWSIFLIHSDCRRRGNVGSVVFKFADSSSSSAMDFSCESNEMLKVFLSRASGASFITRMRFDKPATESYMRKNEPVDIAAAGIEDVDESLVMALSAFDSEETREAIQSNIFGLSFRLNFGLRFPTLTGWGIWSYSWVGLT